MTQFLLQQSPASEHHDQAWQITFQPSKQHNMIPIQTTVLYSVHVKFRCLLH